MARLLGYHLQIKEGVTTKKSISHLWSILFTKYFKSFMKVTLYDYFTLTEAQQTEALVAQKISLKRSEE